jgi:hypothetical protein
VALFRRDHLSNDVRQILATLPQRDRVYLQPGATVHCLVLGSTPVDTVVIDLESGAVLRWRIPWPDDAEPFFEPFGVIEGTLAQSLDHDDLAQPEAVSLADIPRQVGTYRGKHVRALLENAASPSDGPLFGFRGPSAPYWEFRGDRPSVALIATATGPQVLRRREDNSTWVRFGWELDDVWLLCEDRFVARALDAARRESLTGKDLTTALGFRPTYVLATLSEPQDGHCYKICTSLLARS